MPTIQMKLTQKTIDKVEFIKTRLNTGSKLKAVVRAIHILHSILLDMDAGAKITREYKNGKKDILIP